MRYDLIRVESPLGTIVIATTDEGVHALEFVASEQPADWRFTRGLSAPKFEWSDRGAPVRDRVRRYFDGDGRAFDDLQVAAAGTPFQRRVWTALRQVAAGKTTTYGALAASLGRSGAARAVGRANATNPVALIVPCHRVVGSDGTLTGYAGGLDRKRRLLAHEGASLGVLSDLA